MLTKIIPFPDGHFKKEKEKPPLSSLMIVALLIACAKQQQGISFGPGDVKGSFTALITRGLVVRKDTTINHHRKICWQVTPEAILMLKSLGIDVPC